MAFLIAATVQVAAAPAYNGDATFWNGSAGSGTFGGNFTPSLGTNNILIAVVSTELAINYTVTYGATTLTLLRSDCSGTNCQYIYYLVNPGAGPQAIAANAVPDDWNTARVAVFTYSGVDQSTPIGAHAGNNGTPGSSPWSLSMSITPSQSTSTIVQVSNLRTGGCTPTTFTSSAGGTPYTTFASLNNTHGEAFVPWNPGTSGTPVSFNHNYTCASGGGSNFEIAAVELLSAAPAGTATSTRTITATSTRTRTPTPTHTRTPLPSATPSISPTPSMPLVKSSNVAQATIGETVTFCMNWTNDASGPRSIHYWDTISAYLTYVGCSAGCTRTASLVEWTTGAASYASGQGCFWGTVNGYPP